MAFNPTFAGVGDSRHDFMGAIEVAVFDITFSGADTYVTNGLALVAGNFGMSRPIAGVSVIGYNTAAIGMEFFYNAQTGNLQARFSASPVANAFIEVTNGTSIANFSIRVLVIARR